MRGCIECALKWLPLISNGFRKAGQEVALCRPTSGPNSVIHWHTSSMHLAWTGSNYFLILHAGIDLSWSSSSGDRAGAPQSNRPL